MPKIIQLDHVEFSATEMPIAPPGPDGQTPTRTVLSFRVYAKPIREDGEPVTDEALKFLTDVITIPLNAETKAQLLAALTGTQIRPVTGIPDAALRRPPG